KQHVEIKHFYGMSETALQNQVYIALITYCLHVLIQLETGSKKPLLRISRWLKAALWKSSYIWIRRFESKVPTLKTAIKVVVTQVLNVYFYQMDSAAFIRLFAFLF